MKSSLTIVLFFICLSNFAQSNATIYLLFKKDKLHSKKSTSYNRKDCTYYYTYEYERLSENEKGVNLLYFYTALDFDKEILPMFKPKSFIKEIKKKGKLYTCKQ